MRIGLDFRMLSAGRATLNRGMGRYSQQQLREVLAADAENRYVLVCRPDHCPELLLPEIARAPNVEIALLPESLTTPESGRAENELASAAAFDRWLACLDLDLFHATTPFLLMEPLLPRVTACPVLATHYDLIPLVYRERYFTSGDAANLEIYLRVVRAVRQADRLLAISDYVRHEALAYLGVPLARTDVAHPIADPCFVPLAADEAERRLAVLRERTGLGDDFLLTVSHVHHSKNLTTLLRGYALLPAEWRRRHPLVVACDLDRAGRTALLGWARELGVRDTLVIPGFLADDELVALYNAAYLFIHPSRYEGFGLPVLEAMRGGAAVIAGRATSLPEVVGEAGVLVDPEDPGAFSRALRDLDRDGERRQALRRAALGQAERFTGEALGRATLAANERTVEAARRARRAPGKRPRIALWTPLPPQESGVADYAAE
ncbi:MAG TPA: glycosyltransferase family 1 protein, partial [Thermoanaerobaculia bacterium]